MAKRLVVLAGPDEGRVFPLEVGEPLMLGRSRAADPRLIDPHVSRIHCQVQAEGDKFLVLDYESAGGTFVNGKRVNRHELIPGDLIRIGNTRLQYVEDMSEPGPSALAPAPKLGAWAQELVGQTIAHYKLGAILAKGKTGFVFHARDAKRNLPMALKILDPSISENDDKVKRFVEAMKAVLPLRHAHLVRVNGAGKTASHCWIAMEYIAGESLAAVIGRVEHTGPLDWRHIVKIGVYLAQALDYAHSKDLIHQNVTPINILVGRNITDTKLADLMLASALYDDPTKPISAAGVPSEDLSYMPPERTDGPDAAVDPRTDLYSLGATLYAMLAGHPPFLASSVAELVDKIRLDAPDRLPPTHHDLPEGLTTLLRRLLAKRPQDRPETAKDVLQALTGMAQGQGVTV